MIILVSLMKQLLVVGLLYFYETKNSTSHFFICFDSDFGFGCLGVFDQSIRQVEYR